MVEEDIRRCEIPRAANVSAPFRSEEIHPCENPRTRFLAANL